MLILDATTKTLEIDLAGAVSANQLPVTAHYTDITTTAYTPGSSDTASNDTTAVTIVAAPAASTQRHVESISIYNADTAAATVTIQLNNNTTLRTIIKVTLQTLEQLFYEDGMGWQILDANGAVIRGTNVSDTAYAASWDTVTAIAPSKNAVYDQMQLQMLKTGANLAIGSDANGDTYHRAAGALARLAIGSANFKKFVNAAGTAPEWASGVFYGTITRNMAAEGAPTSAATTGVGFKPSALIFLTAYGSNSNLSIGFTTGPTASNTVYTFGTTFALAGGNFVILLIEDSGNTKHQYATLASLDDDGFTLSWTKEGSPTDVTKTIAYLAFR